MSEALEGLRERLLRGGVGPLRTQRYIAELTDHLDDLAAEAQAAGRSPEAAQAEALARLGDAETLAGAMLARPELRSWTSRLPVIAYVLTPAAAMVLLTGAWLLAVVSLCSWLRAHTGDNLDLGYLLGPWADALAWFTNTMLPVLLGWGLAGLALSRRAPPLWPILGLVLLAAIGAALQVDVTLPRPGAKGEIELAANFNALPFGLGSYWGRLAFDLAVTVLPYSVARMCLPRVLA